MLRKLRIAVSVTFAVLAVSIAVCWVRSYWRAEGFTAIYHGYVYYGVGSNSGTVSFYKSNQFSNFNIPWKFYSNEVQEMSGFTPEDSPRYRGLFGFGIGRDPFLTVLGVPHWFLILVAGAAAGLPWIKPRGRFSLRTLLIAMTAIAVALAIAVAMSRGWE